MSDTVRVVKFFDETFKLNDEISEFALMEFAEIAADGEDGDTMAGMAGMMRLIKECVTVKELPRFLKTARDNRASAEDLIPVLQAALGTDGGTAVDRPTLLSSDSSDGQPDTGPKLVANYADKDLAALGGRPDLMLAAQRGRKTAS